MEKRKQHKRDSSESEELTSKSRKREPSRPRVSKKEEEDDEEGEDDEDDEDDESDESDESDEDGKDDEDDEDDEGEDPNGGPSKAEMLELERLMKQEEAREEAKPKASKVEEEEDEAPYRGPSEAEMEELERQMEAQDAKERAAKLNKSDQTETSEESDEEDDDEEEDEEDEEEEDPCRGPSKAERKELMEIEAKAKAEPLKKTSGAKEEEDSEEEDEDSEEEDEDSDEEDEEDPYRGPTKAEMRELERMVEEKFKKKAKTSKEGKSPMKKTHDVIEKGKNLVVPDDFETWLKKKSSAAKPSSEVKTSTSTKKPSQKAAAVEQDDFETWLKKRSDGEAGKSIAHEDKTSKKSCEDDFETWLKKRSDGAGKSKSAHDSDKSKKSDFATRLQKDLKANLKQQETHALGHAANHQLAHPAHDQLAFPATSSTCMSYHHVADAHPALPAPATGRVSQVYNATQLALPAGGTTQACPVQLALPVSKATGPFLATTLPPPQPPQPLQPPQPPQLAIPDPAATGQPLLPGPPFPLANGAPLGAVQNMLQGCYFLVPAMTLHNMSTALHGGIIQPRSYCLPPQQQQLQERNPYGKLPDMKPLTFKERIVSAAPPPPQLLSSRSSHISPLLATARPRFDRAITGRRGVTQEISDMKRASESQSYFHEDPRALLIASASPASLNLPRVSNPEYYVSPSPFENHSWDRVDNFIVGRRGHGEVRFLGSTDVRGMDVCAVVEFEKKQVWVYRRGQSYAPPVGHGLNKSAEVTLFNIECGGDEQEDEFQRRLREQTQLQGSQFISYDPMERQWKFLVAHFNYPYGYGFGLNT